MRLIFRLSLLRQNGAASDAEIDEDEDEEDVEELSLLELAALEASQVGW